jgi:hypothetical protein
MQRQNRMVQKHSWTRIPHDFLGFLPLLRLVAMHGAVCTRSFLFLKGTLIQSHSSVFKERGAFGAQVVMCVVFVFAVDVNHGFDGFLLPRYPRMLDHTHFNPESL